MTKGSTVLVGMFFIIRCAGTTPNEELSLSERLELGMDYLDEEKYLQAQDEFSIVLMRATGTELGDDAQFFLGESYFLNKEYILAIAEYEKLTRNMGFSPFVEKARFRICEAYRLDSPKYYHDQIYTTKALEKYQEFVDDFPNSENNGTALGSMELLRDKLSKKLYETGILYLKMDEYEPARLSLQRVLDEYYDTDIVEMAHVGIIRSYCLEIDVEKARSYWTNFGGQIESEELINEAEILIANAEEKKAKLEK